MRGSDGDVARQVSTLIDTLQALQRELEPGDRRRLRPPTLDELLRFTSDVAIPAAILVLETNVRVLQLLQRTLRMAEGHDGPSGDPGSRLQERAAALSRETLAQLDRTLDELTSAAEGQPGDQEFRRLLDQAKELRAEIDATLADVTTGDGQRDSLTDASDPVDIDIEAELDAIKQDIDDADDPDDQA